MLKDKTMDVLDSFYKTLEISNKQYPTGNKKGNRSNKTQSDHDRWFKNIKTIHIEDGTTVQGYNKYLKSEHWLKIREAMLAEYTVCMGCKAKSKLEIHHKTYDNLGFEKYSDLEVLCRKCHAKRHNRE